MEETIGCKTVQQLETFLQEEYHAQPVEPVDYFCTMRGSRCSIFFIRSRCSNLPNRLVLDRSRTRRSALCSIV
ncbi:MAG: hypothetical protein ACLVD4_08970 [Negativibacillus sp.]